MLATAPRPTDTTTATRGFGTTKSASASHAPQSSRPFRGDAWRYETLQDGVEDRMKSDSKRGHGMRLYRKVVMNGYEAQECPFRREFELAGVLASNPELLSLDDDDLSEPSIIAMEAFIRNGRRRGDGRADIVVAYRGGILGVVELKRGEIDMSAYEQLSDYLATEKGLRQIKYVKEYLEEEETNDKEKIVGVLVGTSVGEEVIEKINSEKNGGRIFAISLRRYSVNSNDVFVLSDVHMAQSGKDRSKYLIGDSRVEYGKGRMVHEVIRRYVEAHPKVTYHELLEIFPKEWRGNLKNGCFVKKSQALRQKEESGYVRHFLKDDDIISLADVEIAVSTQWGAGNINPFIDGVNGSKQIGIKIKKSK